MQIALIVIIVFIILLEIGVSLYIILTYKKNPKIQKIKEPIDTNLVSLMLEDNFVSKVNLLIDSIIKEHAEVYQVMILSTSEDKAQYITTEQQDEMQKYVLHMTLKNLSPEIRSIMKLVYNIDDPKDLRDVVSMRVKLYLINFIIEYNKEFTE